MFVQVLINVVAQIFLFFIALALLDVIKLPAYIMGYKQLPKFMKIIIDVCAAPFSLFSATIAYLVTYPFLSKPDPEDKPRVRWDANASQFMLSYSTYDLKVNPVEQFGHYLVWFLDKPLVAAIEVLLLKLLLPTTFDSCCKGVTAFIDLFSHPMNLDSAKQVAYLVKDLAWDRLVLGGLNENLLLFLLFAFLSAFVLVQNLVQFEQEDDNVSHWLTIPTIAALIVIFNVLFAIINFGAYTATSAVINTFGLTLLLIVTFMDVAALIPVYIIEIIKWIFRNIWPFNLIIKFIEEKKS